MSSIAASSASVDGLVGIGGIVLGYALQAAGGALSARRARERQETQIVRAHLQEQIDELRETSVKQGIALGELFGRMGESSTSPRSPFARRRDDLVPTWPPMSSKD